MFYPKSENPTTRCFVRATDVRYFRLQGARLAEYRRREAHARRVDYAFESSPRARAIRNAFKHPPRYRGHAVTQGVRAHCQRYKGCGYEGACEAETSAPASSGVLHIILCCSGQYRVPTPVDGDCDTKNPVIQ